MYFVICKENGKKSLCNDRGGETCLKEEYDELIIKDGGFLAKRNEYYAYYESSGRCIIPFSKKYVSIILIDKYGLGSYFEICKENGNKALCNDTGSEVISINEECESLKPYYSLGRLVLIAEHEEEGKFSVYSVSGNQIVKFMIGTMERGVHLIIDDNGNLVAQSYIESIILGNIKKAMPGKNIFAK